MSDYGSHAKATKQLSCNRNGGRHTTIGLFIAPQLHSVRDDGHNSVNVFILDRYWKIDFYVQFVNNEPVGKYGAYMY